jgi:thiosulfate/3-mercaptopyruvate sulfurtransferase
MSKLFKITVALMLGISTFSYANDTYGSKWYSESMKQYLISGEEAMKLLGKKNVVFVSADAYETYEIVGHIDGSALMYAHGLQQTDIGGTVPCAPLLMCIDKAEQKISSKGISNDTMVIVYDDFKGPNATGAWLFFKHFGHENVKILNGGLAAILALDKNQVQYDKYRDEVRNFSRDVRDAQKNGDTKKAEALNKKIAELTKMMETLEPKLIVQKGKKEPKHIPGNYKIDESKIRWDLVASKEDVLKAVEDIKAKGRANSKYVIIDSRRMGEIMGEVTLDNVARGGHIPGSTFLEWTNISDADRKLSFKELEDMRKVFEKHGITKDKTIYPYCHVGAGRSTEFQVALKMLGYENVRTYVGSWNEWGNDMNLPISR